MKTPPLFPFTARLLTVLMTLLCLRPFAAPALDPPPASLLGTDTDGDGQPDVAEYFTGTSPTNRTDVVKLDSVRRLTGPDRIELSWQSISGRTYSVQKSTGTGNWTQVTTATANSTRTTLTVAAAPGTEKKSFYRITTAYNEATQPFLLSFAADKASPLTTAGLVRLTLKAYHPDGIVGVDIKDGTTVLGQAQSRGANEFVFDWQADERKNGAHSFTAVMITGNGVARTSNAIALTVNVAAGRQHFTICDTLEISANTVSTVGITRSFSGNVQIGPLTMTGATTVTMNLDTQMITGTGPLIGPGGVQITSSPWGFDAARCLLSLTGTPSPYSLIPGFLTYTPAGGFAPLTTILGGPVTWFGAGTLSGNFPGRPAVNFVNATGGWQMPVSAGAALLTCTQTASFGSGITLDTGGVISVAGVNFMAGGAQPLAALVPMVVNGRLHFPAGTGGPAANIDGFMEVKLPVTPLDPSLPPLVQGTHVSSGLPVIGSVDPDGSFRPAALPPQPEYLLQYLEHFVPLGPDCIPIEGGRVIADALGNLPPCEWRPVIPCAGGGRQTLSLRFPSGLKIVKSGVTSLFQFLHMKLASAPDCPLQLAENYEIHASTELTLDMDDSVTVQDILGVLGINASLGIHIKIFKHFDVSLKAGRFTPKGLVGAVLDFLDDAAVSILDLFPDPGDTFVDFVLDFQCPEWIEIPCRWPASLPPPPGGPGGGYIFDIGGPCECRLRIDVHGGICVYGSAKIRIGTNGPSFHAEINACVDKICIEHLPEDLDFSFSHSWTLPVAETIDIGIAATKSALDPVAKSLLPKICAYERQAVALLRWLDQNPLTDPGPRLNYADMFRRQGKAMLESFANAKTAVPALVQPAEIQAFIRQLGREARTASNFDALLEVWMTLERLKAAGVPTAGDLQSARNEARDEITDRLDAYVSIRVDTALRAVQMFRERKALLAQAGQAEDDAGVATRTGRVIDRAASLAAADLNVAAGVIDITLNPVVRALSLEETCSHVESFVSLFADAASQGIAVTAAARKPELLTQLGRQMDFLLEQLLAGGAVLLGGDQEAYLLQLSRFLQMLKWIASGELPAQVVPALTAAAAMSSLESAVNSLAQTGANAVSAAVYIAQLNAESQQSRTIREKILLATPAGIIIPAQALQQYYARLRAHIDAGWTYLPVLTAEQIRTLLEAGTENARLRDQLGLGDGTIAWESAQRLSAVIDRLVVLSNSQVDLTILETAKSAAMLLMDESWRFDRLPVPNEVKRKFCLLEAEKLGFRLLALANTLRSRATTPVTLNWTGGVKVEQVAAGFCYDIATHAFNGWGSGSLTLPGFGATFNLKRLQFSTNGTATLEVEATGLPGFPNFAVGTTLSLTGTISPNGVWSLTGTAGAVLQKPPGLPWNINIQSNATVTINNTGVHVGVSSTAGGATASGTLDVTAGGAPSFTGTLSLDPITVGVMSLRGPAPSNKITLTVTVTGGGMATVSGCVFTAGAPFNRSVNVPPFSIGPNYVFPTLTATLPVTPVGPFTFGAWTWSLQVTPSPAAITITAGSTTVAAMGGVTSASIPIAGGTISTNGTFSVNGTLTSALAKPANLPWNVVLPVGTTCTLTPNNASFTVTADGTSLVQGTGTVTAAWVTVPPAPPTATVAFSGTLLVDTTLLTTGIYTIMPTGGGAKLGLSVSGGATASVTNARLQLGGPFNTIQLPLPTLTMDAGYNFTPVNSTPQNSALLNYVLNAFQVTVQRVAGVIQVTASSCQLPAPPGLPVIGLSGPINSDGTFNWTSGGTTPTVFGFSATGSFAFGTPAQSGPAAITGLAPEAYWKLDETSGTTAIDATGHGHTGAHAGGPVINQTGAGWPPAGKSYSFNGTSGYVTVPDADTLEGGTAMAVTAWVKVNAFTQDWQPIVTKGDNSWRLHRYGGTNLISFGTNHPGYYDLESTISINDGKWHHITGVFTGTQKLLYIDGRLDRQADVSGAIPSNAQPVMIGSNSDNPARLWNGSLDEVAFWRSALSDEQVRNLYAASIGAALRFNGSITVPGFTSAAISVNGAIGYDNSYRFTGMLPGLSTGSFSLTTSGGGSLSLGLGNSGITVPVSKLRLGELFLPLDLPSFTIPASGDYSVNFTPPELNLRGFPFPNPSLRFRRTGGVTSLDATTLTLMVPAPPAPSIPVPFPNISITNNAPSFSSGSITRSFFGFDLTGGFTFGSPPGDFQHELENLFENPDDPDAPEAWWDLDETGPGTSCPDRGPWGHHGTKTRAAMNNQPPALYPALGRSYEFNGTGDYVTIPDDDYLEGGIRMTIMAWVRVNSLTRDWQTIVSKGDSSWRLSRYGNTNQVSFDTTSGGGHQSLPSAVGINDGEWHHVAGVFDGASKYLYVDGRLENSVAYATTIDSNSYPVMIGENAEATGRFWHGNIDEVVFFRHGISPAEVREMYARGNGLRLFFSGSASLPGINPSISGSITSGGGFDFAGSLPASPSILGFGFHGASFLFHHDENASTKFSAAVSLNNAGALSFNKPFTAEFTRSGGNVHAKLQAAGHTLSLGGFAPKGPGFDLLLEGDLGTSAPLQFKNFVFSDAISTALGVTGLSIDGEIFSSGGFSATKFVNLFPKGLKADNARIDFNNLAFAVSHILNLDVRMPGTDGNFYTRNFGQIEMSGAVQPDAGFTFRGNGHLSFPGPGGQTFNTDNFDVRMLSGGLGLEWDSDAGTPKPKLHFGNLTTDEIGNLFVRGDNIGYSITAGGYKDWSQRFPLPVQDYFYWRLSFGFDFKTGQLAGNIRGDTDFKWKPYPDGPENLVKLKGSIGSDGKLIVEQATVQSGPFSFTVNGYNGPFNIWPFDGRANPQIPLPPTIPSRGTLW